MLEALILGVVQGLTEFFPVSSTAHLILLPLFFGWKGGIDTLTFDVALHAGTLAALLLYFRRDWADMLLRNPGTLKLIVAATLPAGIAGFFLNDIAETALRNPYIISAALVAGGFFMLVSERALKNRKFNEIGFVDAILIGLLQALALVPGVSRSGITISAGLLRGIDREASARFSFLLATPVIGGAVLLHAKEILVSSPDYNLSVFAAGFVCSAVTGLFAIRFLLDFFRKYSLKPFVWYRFMLAVVIIIGLWVKG